MTKKIFFTKSAIKWVDWGNPTVKEVQYTGADWNQYTWIEFEWLASTPALDKGWDIVMEGAFDEYLDEFKEIWAPMLLQHDHDKPIWNYIELTANKAGLYVKGLVKVDRDNVFKALKTWVLRGMSIWYSITKWEYEEDEKWNFTWNFLIKGLRLHEISLVSVWMNQEALLKSFKDPQFKDLSEDEIKTNFKLDTSMEYKLQDSIVDAVEEFKKENKIEEKTVKEEEKQEEIVEETENVKKNEETQENVEKSIDSNEQKEDLGDNVSETEESLSQELKSTENEISDENEKKSVESGDDSEIDSWNAIASENEDDESHEKIEKSFECLKKEYSEDLKAMKIAHNEEIKELKSNFDMTVKDLSSQIKAVSENLEDVTNLSVTIWQAFQEQEKQFNKFLEGFKMLQMKKSYTFENGTTLDSNKKSDPITEVIKSIKKNK